jgi:exopolyphosphatase / guanosine-5'-triphosphate,3'-diphosphate pyrophosphatase
VDEAGRERTLAAIDIGTNSIHLVVARTAGFDHLEVVAQEKEMVRLGSGSGDMKVLTPDAVDRGVAALQRFRKVAEISEASVRAVATSAVREAENRDEFVRRAREEAGIDVEVVSGVEEARLIHLGVIQAVPVFDQRLLLVDIGGGSTEFLVGEGGEMLAARSLKLGAIRLTDRFFGGDRLRRRDVEACRAHVRAYLSPVVKDVGQHGFEVAVGSSGTILNIADMALAARGEDAKATSNTSFTRKELEGVVSALVKAPTAKERRKVPGLDPGRADIIVAGALLLEQAFARLGIVRMAVSGFALREGVLLDTLQRARNASLHRLGDIRNRSVRHLAGLCPGEMPHAEHAGRLALELFDATVDVHGLGEECREFLEAAALLANVGLVISHARHHLHSYYVIRNSELLRGFTEREVEVIAQVARYHRKSAPKAKHEAFARLSTGDQQVVRTLAGILRVAIALDRTDNRVVRRLETRRQGSTLLIRPVVVSDASLELYTADERKALLESALDLAVRFEPVPEDAAVAEA